MLSDTHILQSLQICLLLAPLLPHLKHSYFFISNILMWYGPLCMASVGLKFFSLLVKNVVVSIAKLCPTLLWPHGLLPTRLLCPWHFPGKNSGAGCHFFFQGISQPKDQTCISCIGRQILYRWVTREAPIEEEVSCRKTVIILSIFPLNHYGHCWLSLPGRPFIKVGYVPSCGTDKLLIVF